MGGSIFPYITDSQSFPAIAPPSLSGPPARSNGSKSAVTDHSPDPCLQKIGATILVVEDNDVLRQGIQILLETDGFTVVCASNGLDALNHMQFISPDLILSDISMPKMDGFTFFESVRTRSEWVAIPFIFLTARGGQEDVLHGRKLGAEDYLVKPFNRQELLTTVRARLARNQQLLLVQLQQAYELSLIMLSNAIELRDKYTRGHVERVRDFSLAIARQMGWNAAQILSLKFGSILHDIGKIHIRELILHKPGPLTPEEWEEMKQHPVIGAELVKNVPYLAPALPVIRHHHERWDGKGYPDGLAGEAIPLPARVVAIADSLDAMTTSRPYQAASSPEQAFEEICRGAGEQYDPHIVEYFRMAWKEIRLLMPQPVNEGF